MDTQNHQNHENQSQSQSKKKKMKPVTIVLIVCVALIFCAGIGNFSTTLFNNDMSQASEHIASGEFDKAKEILEKQLDANSSQEKVYLLYADYYLAQGQYLQALDILEKGIKRCSSDDELQKQINNIKSDYSEEIAEMESQKKEDEVIQAQRIKDEYISSCKQISYADLARNPDKYKGQAFVFTGKIIQVSEPTFGNIVSLRINVTKNEYGSYTDTVYATVELSDDSDRLLEDDIVKVYGDCEGLYTYTSVMGNSVSVPKINIQYFDFDTESDKLEGCKINLETSLPQTISDYTYNGSIQSSCLITEVTFEVSGDDLYIYFTGRKTYDSRGFEENDSCKIGWKLYDSNNNVIASGTTYTTSVATEEGFVENKDTAYNCISTGETYKLKLLDVD